VDVIFPPKNKSSSSTKEKEDAQLNTEGSEAEKEEKVEPNKSVFHLDGYSDTENLW